MRKIALLALYTGEPMTAEVAVGWGLVNEVVPGGTALQAALQLDEGISVNAPLAVQASKRVACGADGGLVAEEERAWERTRRESALVRASEDAQEGPRAFAEKRAPVWRAR